MDKELLDYYSGDDLAASAWEGKYAIKKFARKEVTPDDMHFRLAAEIAGIEEEFWPTDKISEDISEFGRKLYETWTTENIYTSVHSYLDKYKYIIPQGSIMSMLGNYDVIGSLSNCFVIPPPEDSYGGIFKTDQEIAQLEKRRGGVGTNLNTLRPENAPVSNAAGSSTGAHSFMERFSSTTREVAQNGRRGALMLLMSCQHPDIFKFVTKKSDLTKVTGANISVMLTDEFMKAATENKDFYCRFPVDDCIELPRTPLPYNELYLISADSGKYIMRIKAKELLDLIIEMAWSNGEPGLAFIDNIRNYCPEGVYPQFTPIASNPCGEQWLQAYDACRLLAVNLFSFVKNPYTKDAELDYKKMYEVFYMQQRFADNIVDLEISAIDRILAKILADKQAHSIKETEYTLWKNVRDVASASRRTGCGFTALADMLAALNLKYDSDDALNTIEKMMRTKIMAEMDCTIDLAIQRGTFTGWSKSTEFYVEGKELKGRNEFYQMICKEFPEHAQKMFKFGRRNVSWSTVAPTGTLSIVAILKKYANTSAGIEPIFSPFYFRNKKVNAGDENVRVDFVDQNGDSWMTYPVIMGGFKEWIDVNAPKAGFLGPDLLPKETLNELFKESPYYGSTANDIDWKQRIKIQSIVQKYTTNAISSTLNLPKDVSKDVVKNIYVTAWEFGLKGVTVYRDGSRTGVMTNEKVTAKFDYKDSVKRPKELDADLNITTVKGVKYGVIIGLNEGKPYEVFGFITELKDNCKGKIAKVKKGHYDFKCDDGTLIKDIQSAAINNDELVLTRLISGMLRHGAKPQFVMEQIDKCNLEVVSFGKAVSRILKKYCNEEEMIKRAKCSNCGSDNLRMQEGCLTCNNCGNSKCG